MAITTQVQNLATVAKNNATATMTASTFAMTTGVDDIIDYSNKVDRHEGIKNWTFVQDMKS